MPACCKVRKEARQCKICTMDKDKVIMMCLLGSKIYKGRLYLMADVIRTYVSANRMTCYSHLHKCTYHERNVIRTCISANK